MKIPQSKFNRLSGNTLLLTVVVIAIVGALLVAYLSLVRSQNMTTMRSQSWNGTVPVIEAGIEDALTHLNAHGSTNLNCDNWTQSGNIYWMKRWVGENYYVVTISNWFSGITNNSPVIESRGFVNLPVLVASAGNGNVLLADAPLPSPTTRNYLGRGVRVTTRQDFVFVKGMVAKDRIDLYGNNIDTDSFDSSDPAHSNNGRYDSTTAKDNGDIATNSSLTNSLNVGNANIKGKVATGPKGSASIGPNGSVGTKAWVDGHNPGFQTGSKKDDMNVDFKDVALPFSGGAFNPNGTDATVGGIYYKYILTDGNWQMSSFSLSGQDKVLVSGKAVLYVTGDFSMTGNSSIAVAAGAALKLYMGAPTATIAGNGIANDGNATNFFYYGLNSNTTLNYSGNASFTGVVYAPNANFNLSGGGSGPYDFVGASVTKTVNMNGHFKFHYDEALAKYGPPRGFIVTSWNEMTPREVTGGPAIDYSANGVIH